MGTRAIARYSCKKIEKSGCTRKGYGDGGLAFTNQREFVERKRPPIERLGAWHISVAGARIMTTPEQISKRPIGAVRRLLEIYYPRLLRSTRVIKRCFCPRRSVLRSFQCAALLLRYRQPNGKQTERKRKKKKNEPPGRRTVSCRNTRRRKFRYQARYAIYLS